jgi:hypothetical protein
MFLVAGKAEFNSSNRAHLHSKAGSAKLPLMQHMRTYTTSATRAGIGFGSALAITISWSLHKSIIWAIIHGVLSWFYVIYYVLTR